MDCFQNNLHRLETEKQNKTKQNKQTKNPQKPQAHQHPIRQISYWFAILSWSVFLAHILEGASILVTIPGIFSFPSLFQESFHFHHHALPHDKVFMQRNNYLETPSSFYDFLFSKDWWFTSELCLQSLLNDSANILLTLEI